ncbi:hypothetical protein [Wolbachia endosymbiont (group A) of Endotricha flammealis]|uniref:hypothetical protein n=1 Tax=Wolbachia endosymbiont (group A) of Endotricha flammealis TaxID=2954004 RepID=UPI00223100DE|nr:hypothetical protein [Wolbachia endosymbiont (group A) of Endotricha flammealis]
MPKNFPRWENIYYYFQTWNKKNGEEPSLLELVLKKLIGEVRINNGRKEKTSFCIINVQSVKNTSVPLLINADMNLSSEKRQDHLNKKEVIMTAREYLDSLRNSKNIEEVVQATEATDLMGIKG